YTIVGASALGPLRCVVTSHVTAIAAWRGSSASTMTYRSLITAVQSTMPPSETLTSLTLEHLFTWAGATCYSYTGSGGDGLQACQSLGNLCALQLHDPSSMACSLFSAVLNNRLGNNHGQTGWGVTLPWLTYIEEASDVRDGTDIEMQLTFASEMRIILAKYSLDGTWLGMEEMSTQTYYCGVGAPDTSAGGGQSRSSKYLKFGHSMTETFECDLKSLLGEEAFFYDPYIATGELHPIAVLNVNYGDGASTPNLNIRALDELDDVFTRRFFFFDSVSGITDASGTTSSFSPGSDSEAANSGGGGVGGGGFVPEVLRYATSMRLTFKIRDGAPESIYPPILEASGVTYAEVKPALWDTQPSLQQPTVTFTVEYTMDTQLQRPQDPFGPYVCPPQSFWNLCRAFFAVVLVLTSLTGLWRLRNWHVRVSRYIQPAQIVAPRYMYQMVNWPFLFQGLLMVSHTFVLFLFPFTFLISSYFFVFFKLQVSSLFLV
ncbi:unnamed protein product, partial [Ectocarpus sp. 8 AP-2014]